MNNKSPLDDDWLDIAQDWQSQVYKEVDTSQLIRSIKWRIFKSKAIFASNIIATLSLIVSFVMGMFKQWETPLMAYLGFGIVASTIFVVYEYKIRSVTWHYKQSTPLEVMHSAAQNYNASIAYLKLNFIAFVICLPAVNWFVYASVTLEGKSPYTSMLIASGLLVFACIVIYLLKRHRMKALAELNKRIESYSA